MKADFNIAVYDCETGGLSANKTQLLEIAVCPFNTFTMEDLPEFDSGIIAPYNYLHKHEPTEEQPENPFEELNKEIQECIGNKDGQKWMKITKDVQKKGFNGFVISQGALNANGISIDKVMNGRPVKEVFKELCDFLKNIKKGRNKPLLCGHNVDSFDNSFLETLFELHGKKISDFKNITSIDTMWWSRLERIESKDYKLGTSCENQGIVLKDAHRAINDTRANKELIKKYISKLRGEGQQVSDGGVVPRFREKFEM